ncbi:MAG: hypothetical protein ACRCU5_07220 [Rhizobiaceae bacterium]
MRIQNTTIQDLLQNTDPKRLIVLAKLEFPSGTIRAHSGIGPRVYSGEIYLGVGNLANVSQLKEGAGVSANRITFSIRHDDPVLFAAVLNDNPVGRLCELTLVTLDEDRQMVGGVLLFSGEIADYALEKGRPYTISVTASDWFEVWGRPVQNSKWTDESQKAIYPDDNFFNQVEIIAQGIDDTIPGKYIGGGGGGNSGGEKYER